ncbi:MAG: hypothetical protein M1833_004611 [Piccolia ochrophora]|nr:MAG: hypothetical protein M1833_004611 [Piccolia ochrophora]
MSEAELERPRTSPRRPRPHRLVGVSTKMYFSLDRTRSYMTSAVSLLPTLPTDTADIFILPDFLSILTARDLLGPTPILYGAQDAHWADSGAHTGEVSPAALAEAGCRFVEIGHAERRAAFGETDADVAKKAEAVTRNGLVPLVCIGERTEGGTGGEAVGMAVEECRPQVEAVLGSVPVESEIVLAYEPVWAIGKSEPASADHIVGVTSALRRFCEERREGTTKILYGGSAGPGLFAKLKEGVDGLFLGRFAHDVEAFAEVIREVGSV